MSNFKTDVSQASETVQSALCRKTVDGRKLLVIDTPGFYNTNLPEKEFKKELMTAYHMTSPGPHAFVYTIPKCRLYNEHLGLLNKLESIFGSDVFKYLIVVLAVHELETENTALKDDAEILRNFLKDSLKHDIRVVVVDNIINYCQSLGLRSLFECLDQMKKENQHADLRLTNTCLGKLKIWFLYVSSLKICSTPFIFMYIMCAFALCAYFIYKICLDRNCF